MDAGGGRDAGAQVGLEVLTQGSLGLEVGEAERLFGENAEEALDLIEPGRAGRRVVEVHARMFREPGLDLGRSVRRRVVEHDVELAPG